MYSLVGLKALSVGPIFINKLFLQFLQCIIVK